MLEGSTTMRKISLALAIVALGWAQASAGTVLDQFIQTTAINGVKINTWLDDSVSRVVFTEDGTLSEGDIVQGIIRLTNRSSPGSFTPDADEQLIIAFSFKIGTPEEDFDISLGNDFDLVPVQETDGGGGFTLLDMLPDQLTAYSYGDLTDAIFVILDGVDSVNPISVDLASALAELDDTGTYSLDLIGGIVEDDDFLEATFTETDLATIAGMEPTEQIGLERGGLSQIFNLTPYSFADTPAITPLSGGSATNHQFTLTATLNTPSETEADNDWQISDDARIRLDPNNTGVPEPASLLLWGTGFVAFAGMRKIRRRSQVAA
ncbi:MAG: PEP-CTERM sorting domain-containing protein [Planctomycetaceae bacterium]